ncbi:SDR family NAD(P)-dependent oxidoreductase [Vicingaceae bacterium]|nr:SDR family NAD(P)-dependent oxidoreductase [Vicingaceae bacterium]
MTKIALITGATSGIGEATAIEFAKHSYNLIITGRRAGRLLELARKITEEYDVQVQTLIFDVRVQASVIEAINSLPEDWRRITVLVNNAGLASGLDPIQSGNVDDWEKMIDTNVKGLLYVSKSIIPLMIANKKGHIVNISSIAGKEAYANGNVYCATKHAVEALTKSMRIDLLKEGIRVSSVSPGMVDTEFSQVRFHGDAKRAEEVYKGFEPLHAEDIAETIWFIASRPAHVNINDVLIMPTAQASAVYVNKD